MTDRSAQAARRGAKEEEAASLSEPKIPRARDSADLAAPGESVVRESLKSSEMQAAIRQSIRAIPPGKVATYGQVAAAAGYPRGHRQVAQLLRNCGDSVPWHRVLGAGGQIKTRMEAALDQRLRLEMEGVRFRGARVDLGAHQSPLHDPAKQKFRKAKTLSGRSSAPRP